MITKDLNVIKEQCKRKENLNWRFRSYLKTQDDEKIDELVRPIYQNVTKNINCLECGNCCRHLRPVLAENDIRRLKTIQGWNNDEFVNNILEVDEDKDLRLKGSPCVFLKDNACKIYSYRPNDCRSYPHLHKKYFTSRLFFVIENLEICPIVYNIFEELKENMNFR
jgi:Fe-S-cluster containining protein